MGLNGSDGGADGRRKSVEKERIELERRMGKNKSIRGRRKKREIRNTAWKGSYTVEAAAVVSITIFVLAALIIAAFYVHDRAVFQSFACETATAGSIQATQSERTDAADSVKEQVTPSRFLGSRNLSGSVSSGEEEVTASWSATYPVPGFVMRYLADGDLSIEASWSSKAADPAAAIRLIRGAGELITGGDD